MPDIDSLTERLGTYLTGEQINKVRRAYYYAEQAHDGQKRRSGESYITHPLAVATILAKMRMDFQGLMAAMLHDVIEDSDISKKAIVKQFGQTVADIVDGVSKLAHIRFENKALAQAENFQKMSLALAKDIRVILVKLADRMHNMRTLGAMPPYKRRLKAIETLEIYSPIAQRLGMHNMRVEFEELGFSAMYPMRAKLLSKAVNKVRGKREEIVNQVVTAIQKALIEHSIPAKVSGREKHLYSIYKKMKMQRKSFSEIMDVFGVRIIAQSTEDCYRVLGLIHGLYKPFPGRFKDYIAIPKANGYKSLHTTLFGSKAIPVEVQIRTNEMESMANNGIAAHWLYKEKDAALAVSQSHSRGWIQNLLELQQKSTDSLEFIESVKTDLFPDEVYVFTPQGDILELPRGATAIDFAYAVHTQIGNTCVACRINRRLASLNEPLESGQTVEIITTKNTQPSSTWLNFAVSSKARSNIRHYLKNQSKAESIHLGQRLLTKVLIQIEAPVQDISGLSEENLDILLKEFGSSNKEDLLEDIGLGKSMTYMVANHLMTLLSEQEKTCSEPSADNQSLLITGREGSVMCFASCCHPIPGDRINGCLKSGQGIIIHRQDCSSIISNPNNYELLTDVGWDPRVQGHFNVQLLLSIEHNTQLFAAISSAIATMNAEIIQLATTDPNTNIRQMMLALKVKDRIHLAKIIRRLRHIPDILDIIRQ